MASYSDFSCVRQRMMLSDVSEVRTYFIVWKFSVWHICACHKAVACFIASSLFQNKTHTAVAGVLEVRLFLCRKYWGEILALIGLHIIFRSIQVFQYTSLCASKELWRKAFWRESKQKVCRDRLGSAKLLFRRLTGEERNFKCETKRVILKAYNIHCWQHDV